jgi:hypothetical protein
MTYERITYRDGRTGRRHTVILADPAQRDSQIGEIVTGRQVNRDGGDVNGRGPTLMIVTPAEVVSREPLEMDLHYGWLVPRGTATIPVQEGRTPHA